MATEAAKAQYNRQIRAIDEAVYKQNQQQLQTEYAKQKQQEQLRQEAAQKEREVQAQKNQAAQNVIQESGAPKALIPEPAQRTYTDAQILGQQQLQLWKQENDAKQLAAQKAASDAEAQQQVLLQKQEDDAKKLAIQKAAAAAAADQTQSNNTSSTAGTVPEPRVINTVVRYGFTPAGGSENDIASIKRGLIKNFPNLSECIRQRNKRVDALAEEASSPRINKALPFRAELPYDMNFSGYVTAEDLKKDIANVRAQLMTFNCTVSPITNTSSQAYDSVVRLTITPGREGERVEQAYDQLKNGENACNQVEREITPMLSQTYQFYTKINETAAKKWNVKIEQLNMQINPIGGYSFSFEGYAGRPQVEAAVKAFERDLHAKVCGGLTEERPQQTVYSGKEIAESTILVNFLKKRDRDTCVRQKSAFLARLDAGHSDYQSNGSRRPVQWRFDMDTASAPEIFKVKFEGYNDYNTLDYSVKLFRYRVNSLTCK